jgi:hypothetical protein
VGRLDGIAVGAVGARVGASVGAVGTRVGASVTEVGTRVGVAVGVAVVGEVVGIFVGKPVGTCTILHPIVRGKTVRFEVHFVLDLERMILPVWGGAWVRRSALG